MAATKTKRRTARLPKAPAATALRARSGGGRASAADRSGGPQPGEADAGNAADHLAPFASPLLALEAADLGAAAARSIAGAMRRPGALTRTWAGVAREFAQIAAKGVPSTARAPDRRFADPAWTENALFRRLMHAYLAYARELRATPDAAVLDGPDRELARLALGLFADAVAPTNFLLTNPAALRKAAATGGRTLAAGVANFAREMLGNAGRPLQVDASGFRLGDNIAATPGAVVFRNDVLELIQYAPATARVQAEPVLLVPSPVNRYYVLDLAPGRSLVQHLVGEGFTVFAVSLLNPGRAQRDWGIDTYASAVVQAIDAVHHIAGRARVHLAGSCAGGIVLAAVLAALKARSDARIASATLLVTMFDATGAGGAFELATERLASRATARSARHGIVTDRKMFWMFALLRPNDAIWSYWVNNYLLGQRPPAIDLLYWANDHTNLAARMHADLVDVFVRNRATSPGGIEVLGVPVDLRSVDVDTYALAAAEDHLMPWQGCYRSLVGLGGGNKTFVLHTRGHITSLVHPPSMSAGSYQLRPDGRLPDDADEWKRGAALHRGSWWPHWAQWLRARSSAERAAPRTLGNRRHPILASAPGTYVRS